MSLRRMAAGFASMAAATALSTVVGFVMMVVLARRLPADDIGAYSFALALVGYFALPANFGVTGLAIRDLAQRPDDGRRIMSEVLSLQALACLVPYALLILTSPLLVPDADARSIVPIVGLLFVFDGLTFAWVLNGMSRFNTVAVARIVGGLAFAVGVLLFVHAGPHAVLVLGIVTTAGVVATGAITAWTAIRAQGFPPLTFDGATLWRRFRLGVPLGIAGVMVSIYYSIDSLMLGYIKGTEEVGIYAIAYKIPLAVSGIAGLWGTVLFPHFSALQARSRKELREQLSLFASVAVIGSFPVLAGSILVGHDLVPRLFGPQYASGATPFILLMAASALILFALNFGTTLIAIGEEKHYAIAVTVGAVANLLINAVTIPLFSMVGAACATVAAEVLVFLYVRRRVVQVLGPVPLDLGRVVRAALATLMMVAVLLPLGHTTVLVRVAIGTVVFLAACAVLRVIRPEEVRQALGSERDVPPIDPVVDAEIDQDPDRIVP